MAELIAPQTNALELVLDFIRALEAGGDGGAIGPFLAADYVLVEAPHLLAAEAPRGRGTRRWLALIKAAK